MSKGHNKLVLSLKDFVRVHKFNKLKRPWSLRPFS